MGNFKKHKSPTEVSHPPCLPFNYHIAHCFYYFYQVFILHIFNNLQGYGKFQAQDLQNSFVHDCAHGRGGGGRRLEQKERQRTFDYINARLSGEDYSLRENMHILGEY